MNTSEVSIQPSDFMIRNFMGSNFKNSETETVAQNIVFVQNCLNPNEWTPFTWEDYCKYCTDPLRKNDKKILDCLVNGGKPVWNTTVFLQPGYLSFNEGSYRVTEKFLETIKKFKN